MTFQEIYQQHKNIVYNLALQYTQNAEDAEEITQDVFVKVYEKLDSFRQEAALTTWIYRITIHQSLDFLKAKKAKKRWTWTALFSLNEEEKPLDIPHFNHPGVELEQREALERLFGCINELPDQQKTALILLKIEDKTQAETADIMGLSVKAVESLFQRAKKTLEKKLNQSEG